MFWLGAVAVAVWFLKDFLITLLIARSHKDVNDARKVDAHLDARQKAALDAAKKAKEDANKAAAKVGKPNDDGDWNLK